MKNISIIAVIIVVSMLIFYSINEAASIKSEKEQIINPIATMKLSNEKTVKIELYPRYAPNTVNNFIDLVNKKFYNNMVFSRVVPQYLLHTGDPIGDGTGFPGYFIKSECRQNGFKNKLKSEAGVICMARAKKFNTEGSQFFILLQNDSSLNGQYAVFGKVIEGLDILQEIGKLEVSSSSTLVEDIRIRELTVETFGIDYDEPEVLSVYEQRIS